jgi:prephenate dehydrogenase
MRVAVLGVGLIGGSVGLAARDLLGAEVRGWDPSADALEAAVARGALDEPCAAVGEALEGAELAFVAAPVGAIAGVAGEALAAAGEECVVTDVGSTKRPVVAVHGEDARFVGGHPLAGAETKGVEHARADLFQDAVWYLTPTARTSGILYEKLHRTLVAIGARPQAIDPESHDRLLASVSHLPHVLANVLVWEAARTAEASGERLPATGPSFRDATRVAGANTGIWTDIYRSNRDALTEAIDRAIGRLGEVRAALEADDPVALAGWNDGAAADRRHLLEAELAGAAVHELRVSVPNKPGVIAELALALGRGGVNILDMALYPAPDFSEGTVALWIAGDSAASRAEHLVAGLGFPVARA